ncbi:MAG: D-aminoacylase [Kiritimatiellae bacterium]|nr:D-aminoacylase [Kiritimatiellia bacterium]MDD5519280.1 D-aminoacylase [Kiritimatiellia bacterium]
MFDIKITDGQVLDGTGCPAAVLDIGITGDQIKDMGDLSKAEAKLIISAAGKCVCPGFIDAHSHSDTYLLIEPSAPSKIFQGITTEIVGNCGASAAPLVGKYHMPADWLDKEYPGKWNTVTEYRQLLGKMKPAPNVVLLIGHNTLRAGVAGYENRPLSDSELREAKKLLEQSMEEGGHGFSTGLIYAPAMFASREELVELAKVAAKHDGIYTSHMRSEGTYLLKAIEEAVSIGRDAGLRVQISHLKTSGRKNWPLVDKAIRLIRKAREEGLEVAADRYPYTSGCTDLDVIFPEWAAEGGREVILSRLRNSSERKRLREDLLKEQSENDWSGITIGSTNHRDNKKFRGMPLFDIAKRLGMEPVDTVLYFAASDELKTSAFFAGMSEENMMKILAEPYVMLGTDASLRALEGPLSKDYPHPRAYGSFPRFLRMSLDGKTVSLPEAVRKMTSLPAKHFQIKDRGIIAKGKKADIVVFDAVKLRDVSDYSVPHQLSKGIEYLIVNGVLTITKGAITGSRAGKML